MSDGSGMAADTAVLIVILHRHLGSPRILSPRLLHPELASQALMAAKGGFLGGFLFARFGVGFLGAIPFDTGLLLNQCRLGFGWLVGWVLLVIGLRI